MHRSKPLSRRSFLTVAATTLGGLAMAACGAAPTATPAPKPTQAAPTAAPVATPAPAKAVEIQFRPIVNWATNGADIWRQEVANIMAKKPHLKIVATGATNSDADEQQLITTMAAGTGPDVWCHGGSSGGYWGAKGVAAPLDDYLKKSPMAGDYFDAGLMPHSWGGKLYAIGLYIGPNQTQWRKDIFKEVGLDPEKGPTSWQNLGEMGQKLAQWKGEDIQRVGFNIPASGAANQAFYFGLYMHTAGGAWFTEDFKKTRINEQPGVDALQFVVDLYHKYKVNATYAVQASTPGVPLMVTGQAAMDWVNFVPYVYAKTKQPPLLANWGMMPTFTGPKSAGGIIFVNTALMNAKSKVKDACLGDDRGDVDLREPGIPRSRTRRSHTAQVLV